ncbi:MAG: YlxR family protein [Peptococcaceae bacterium]|nr:YlxR family protein [Peptococcaceae bacterium]
MMPKRMPQRTCMACQEKKDKRDLVRIVRSPEGEISVDLTGKKPGRGAYICPNLECLNKVIKSKRLERSLETAISQEIYESLKEQLT